MSSSLTPAQLDTLKQQGFVVARSFAPAGRCEALRAVALEQLAEARAPVEYEADLAYPGAPASRQAEGGATVRRLLDAYARHPLFAEWATSPAVAAIMRAYFGESAVLSRAHHNCVMTKHPRFGSLTGWHRDIRYWSFEREDLVSTWLALGEETSDNGGLWLVPGSHVMELPAHRFDAAQFLREDLPENAALIGTAVCPRLEPGDVLFFHCRTLHAAGRNQSDRVKLSVVHTYHAASTHPHPGTRSASKPEIPLNDAGASAP
ncbi:phytanoyl-CoA dioxygenase family protein [Bordetella genomosp. 9]|uniref:Phytanoyl-CoA dioxygenase n=1 Tax=Bordetella genomosp. 9 TaxID=1416803 RepID=A0A1W6Z0H9_9BORD|nr:phytanoyl-CoA dioxygenase family protein [Bordetella genomosp. 9]ARP86850.1 phytanoyl-CoA dioxygenase [Bordetella genomosp. 9]ARP90836.1 phytanoyl-CoA dioxygenase [Bordetella genomosp. 9]